MERQFWTVLGQARQAGTRQGPLKLLPSFCSSNQLVEVLLPAEAHPIEAQECRSIARPSPQDSTPARAKSDAGGERWPVGYCPVIRWRNST